MTAEVQRDQGIHNVQFFHRLWPQKQVDAVSWAFLLIWLGVAFLLNIGWPIGLIGVGLLLLLEIMIRQLCHMQYDGFWVVVGIFMMATGVGRLVGPKIPYFPLLLVILGILIMFSPVFWRNKP